MRDIILNILLGWGISYFVSLFISFVYFDGIPLHKSRYKIIKHYGYSFTALTLAAIYMVLVVYTILVLVFLLFTDLDSFILQLHLFYESSIEYWTSNPEEEENN